MKIDAEPQIEDYRRGFVTVRYDANLVSRGGAWKRLCTDFKFTMAPPFIDDDGGKDYRGSNPWRRHHEYSDFGEPLFWGWSCPVSIFIERHAHAIAEAARAALVDSKARRGTLGERLKALLWGNW